MERLPSEIRIAFMFFVSLHVVGDETECDSYVDTWILLVLNDAFLRSFCTNIWIEGENEEANEGLFFSSCTFFTIQ
jgi:hypothetical protein